MIIENSFSTYAFKFFMNMEKNASTQNHFLRVEHLTMGLQQDFEIMLSSIIYF